LFTKIISFGVLNKYKLFYFPLKHLSFLHKGGPCYMQTFYLQFFVYAIKIMAFQSFQRNISSNLPMLLVSLYANLLYASQFLGPYLSHITRAAWISKIFIMIFHFILLTPIEALYQLQSWTRLRSKTWKSLTKFGFVQKWKLWQEIQVTWEDQINPSGKQSFKKKLKTTKL